MWLPQNRYRWRVAMARVRQAEGDLAGALELLDEAERLYMGDMFPNVRPVPALKARAWIAQGSLGEALGWAREQGLSVDDDLSYLRELEVLRMLGTDLDGPAIARELTVSLNTVRTHTKHIYAKLAVTSRRAAVRRAQELDLVSRTRNRQP
jgi:ATP/maltotriose-dependent transcriptional regulator MalT